MAPVDAVVRAAVPDDARAVAEVHVASWRWAYRGLLPDDLLDGLSVGDREADWASWLADPALDVVVAERSSRIVGFASGSASRDADALLGTGEVLTLYVTLDAAGTGMGRLLLGAVVAAMRDRGFHRATLWVLEANDRARRFYERAGWTWDGARADHQVRCANRPIVRYAAEL